MRSSQTKIMIYEIDFKFERNFLYGSRNTLIINIYRSSNFKLHRFQNILYLFFMEKSDVQQNRQLVSPVIFGTSSLGNLYKATTQAEKCAIIEQCMRFSPRPVLFDTAGKYGAGLALESFGYCLRQLNVSPSEVIISNKLGWFRTELSGGEPSFEPGIWKNLENDCIQKVSYEGILECYEQGNQLLNGYSPQWVSVHDPDEYVRKAVNALHRQELYQQVLDAYRALGELKRAGKVDAIGVGAKDWRIIEKLSSDVELDWVMIANSLTIKEHSPALLSFIKGLESKGVMVINSAVFHSGFLTGGDYFDYKIVSRDTPAHQELFVWRDTFFKLCDAFGIAPAHACIQFALKVPGVAGIALNTSDPGRVKRNIDMAKNEIPAAFWRQLQSEGLIEDKILYL